MSKAHSSFGASGAHRWLVCPASVPLQAGLPDTANVHSAEGTAAHELGEMALRSGKDCGTYLGMTLHADGFEFEVTDEMAENVQIYVDYVRSFGDAAVVMVERKFDLAKIRPPAPMFGTADAVIYVPDQRLLVVVDLKYGRGKVVDVRDNPQLKYYGLGAMLDLPKDWAIDTVRLVVVQPRAGGDAVRPWDTTPDVLLDYAMDVIEAARRALEDQPEAVPGDHCGWCRAAGTCPGLRAQALAVAQDEFGGLPAPEQLTPAQVGELLNKADVVEEWLSGLRGHAFRLAESGVEIPGRKLVPKRGTRQWAAPEEEIVKRLTEKGAVTDDLFSKKLISPAQAEKVVGKKNLPSELVATVSSGFNLVRDSHPGESVSVLPAGHEFTTE